MAVTRVSTDGLADSAVNSAKIGVDVITDDDLANNSVTANEITNNAVTSNKIAANAVTSAKLDTNIAVSGNLDANVLRTASIKHTNNTAAMTIDSAGRLLTPARPTFVYVIQQHDASGPNHISSAYKFGNQGSNAVTTNYLSPIPFVNSITSDGFATNVGSCASFHDHPVSSSYKYLKFTAPIAGLYCFGMSADFANRHTALDYLGFGLKKNFAGESGSGANGDFDCALVHARADAERGVYANGNNVITLAENDYVVFHHRSCQEIEFHVNSANFFGYLVG